MLSDSYDFIMLSVVWEQEVDLFWFGGMIFCLLLLFLLGGFTFTINIYGIFPNHLTNLSKYFK